MFVVHTTDHHHLLKVHFLSYRDEYSKLLQLCVLLCEGRYFTDTGLPVALREMLKRMKEDLGKAAASSVAISSVLPLASNQAQVERMWSNLVTASDGESTE